METQHHDWPELHPFFIQRELRDMHARLGIATQSWSPLGGVKVYAAADPKAAQSPLAHRIVVSLAATYRKTPAQIVLRWHVEHGLSAIPKSVRPGRIMENIDTFDFTLTKEDLATLDAIDTGARGGPDPEIVNPKLFDPSIPDAT